MLNRWQGPGDVKAAGQHRYAGEELGLSEVSVWRRVFLSKTRWTARKRLFAHGRRQCADDGVLETVHRAWTRQDDVTPSSNLEARLCTISHNPFHAECRERRRVIGNVDGSVTTQRAAPAAREHRSDLPTVRSPIGQLPEMWRGGLLLVSARDLTYEAAAEVMGCQTGPVKSRARRARAWRVANPASEEHLNLRGHPC